MRLKVIDPKVFFLAFGLIILVGCSTDLDLFDEKAPLPIVFCLLNPSDEYAYVTLTVSDRAGSNSQQRIFVDDNLENQDISILLEGWSRGFLVWESGFSRVTYPDSLVINGQALSRPLFRSDSILRLCNQTGAPNGYFREFDHFRLIVTSPEFDEVAYSRIPIFRAPIQNYPLYPMSVGLYNQDWHLDYSIDWPETKVSELNCVFHFKEFDGYWRERSIQFPIMKTSSHLSKNLTIRFNEEVFLKHLNQLIEDVPSISSRIFISADFVLLAADQYFFDYWSTYQNATETDNSNFGNITNGIGLFSLIRSYRYGGVGLDRRTLDSLCRGRFTKHLNFKDW